MTRDLQLERRVARLASLCVDHLASLPLRSPHFGESERAYSTLLLGPAMSKFVRQLDISGLHVGGDGAGPAATAPFLGCSLKPDLTILSFHRRILAVEVKLVRSVSLSSDVSKAVGQAALYHASGFDKTAIFLIDKNRILAASNVKEARERLRKIGICLVVRQQLADQLVIDKTCSSEV